MAKPRNIPTGMSIWLSVSKPHGELSEAEAYDQLAGMDAVEYAPMRAKFLRSKALPVDAVEPDKPDIPLEIAEIVTACAKGVESVRSIKPRAEKIKRKYGL